MSETKGWIGVDLDGTLAMYDGWKGIDHIGEPIPAMVERVKKWLAEGKDVRIFTARCAIADAVEREAVLGVIRDWCKQHIGQPLNITCTKDFDMIELWDDRCIQVTTNTGEPIVDLTIEAMTALFSHVLHDMLEAVQGDV